MQITREKSFFMLRKVHCWKLKVNVARFGHSDSSCCLRFLTPCTVCHCEIETFQAEHTLHHNDHGSPFLNSKTQPQTMWKRSHPSIILTWLLGFFFNSTFNSRRCTFQRRKGRQSNFELKQEWLQKYPAESKITNFETPQNSNKNPNTNSTSTMEKDLEHDSNPRTIRTKWRQTIDSN